MRNTANPLRVQLLGEDLDRRLPARTDRGERGANQSPQPCDVVCALAGEIPIKKRWQEFAQGLEGRNELQQQG